MAYLRLRGSSYHLIYYNEKSERKSFSLKTTNRKKADSLLKQFQAQQVVALPFEIFSQKPKILFSDALLLFLKSRRTVQNTKDSYNYAALSWKIHTGDKYINLYTPEDYDLYRESISDKSQATIESYSFQLFVIFNWFVKEKYITDNPIVKPRRNQQKEVNPIPLNELAIIKRDLFVRGMFKQLDLVTITFLCALRISEALLMEYSDFDFENKVIYIRNVKGNRVDKIPMLQDIKDYCSQLDFSRSGRMFQYAHRQSISFWRFVNARYGFRNTFHSLRKARGSQLANSGVEPLLLRDFMRHHDIRTTLKYYIKIDQDKSREKIDSKLLAQF